jgi:predicted nucleotidyltransferase
VDAQPELVLLARALNENRLEAILIGNMAAALHGAPVSTIDIDLFFRKTPANMQKLKRVATVLERVILRPYYPASALFRLQRDRDGLQIDFMGQIDGVKSYESVRGRAASFEIGGEKLLAASLEDVILNRRETGRGRDLAVISLGRHELKRREPKKQRLPTDAREALRLESDRALLELIRYRLSLPPEKRLNCLRRKIGLRATCL